MPHTIYESITVFASIVVSILCSKCVKIYVSDILFRQNRLQNERIVITLSFFFALCFFLFNRTQSKNEGKTSRMVIE